MTSYADAHRAVRRARGRANGYICARCGRRPAYDWAYDHEDPSVVTNAAGQEYSLDPAHYRPMCRSCHLGFDQGDSYLQRLAYVLNQPCTQCGAAPGLCCASPAGFRWTGAQTQHMVRRRAAGDLPQRPTHEQWRKEWAVVRRSELLALVDLTELAAELDAYAETTAALVAMDGQVVPAMEAIGAEDAHAKAAFALADAVLAQAARPGQGYRTDKHREEPS